MGIPVKLLHEAEGHTLTVSLATAGQPWQISTAVLHGESFHDLRSGGAEVWRDVQRGAARGGGQLELSAQEHHCYSQGRRSKVLQLYLIADSCSQSAGFC